MDNTPKIPGALSIIAEQLPKWWNDPGSEGLKGTVETMIPQDAVDLGLMVAGGPGGKLARKAGVALMGAGASTDAEAGVLVPLLLTGLKKYIPEILKDLRAGLSREAVLNKYGVIAMSDDSGDLFKHLPSKSGAVDQFTTHDSLKARPLEELYANPELYKMVPNARRASVIYEPKPGGALGYYSSSTPKDMLPKSDGYSGRGLEAIVQHVQPNVSQRAVLSNNFGIPDLSKPGTVLEHELNHLLQARVGSSQSRIGNPKWNTRVEEIMATLGAQNKPSIEVVREADILLPLRDPRWGTSTRHAPALVGKPAQQDYARGIFNGRSDEKVKAYLEQIKPNMAQGGSVKRPMEHTRSSGQDASTQPLSGSALKALVRGWMAGTAGLPGDLEGLTRTVDKYTTLNPAIRQLKDTTPVLPTADFYKEWLPGKQQGDEVIGDIGSLFGGVGATKPVALGRGALSRIAAATPAPRAGSMAAQRGVIKAPGGNWLSGSVEDALKGLKQGKHAFTDPYTPEQVAEMEQYFMANPGKPGSTLNLMGAAELMDAKKKLALNAFVDKQLRNYVRNDMATERDPIRALAESWATAKPQKLAEAQARIDALTAKGQELAATRGVPQEYLTRHRQDVIAAEKAKELIELRQGLHFQPNELPTVNLAKLRSEAGFPVGGFGQSDLAKTWENVSDAMLRQKPASYYQQGIGEVDDWLKKVAPDTRIYQAKDNALTDNLGFDHLMDELRNAVNPESGLPKELLFDPAHMGKITVPQAVERVADINAWRAAQKAEADMARANNAATVLHKDYPEKGMKWVELKKTDTLPEGWSDEFVETPLGKLRKFRDPKTGGLTATDPTEEALRDALKYEGDTMKHCVGGYCAKVADGSTRIYSLRDAKGRPHVTIEEGKPSLVSKAYLESLPDPDKQSAGDIFEAPSTMYDYIHRHRKGNGDFDEFAVKTLTEHGYDTPPPRILQIKGPSNKKPNDEYLPFVQDFVRSGKWSDVGDLHHTGLRRATDAWNPNEEKMIRAAGIDFPTHATQQEIDAINQQVWPGVMGPAKPPGYAEGGSVTAPTWQDAFNEFDKAHRAEFDIGIDRPWAKDEDSVAAKQRIDQRYIDSLKAYDPTLTPDQSVLGANAQPNAYQPKPEGGGWLSQQLSNIGNIFRPVTSSVDDFAKDVRSGAGGVINEASQLASEATGGIVSPDAAKVIAAIAYAVATGDPKTAAELGATEAEVAAAIESASTGASFGWTDAIASSLSPELLSASPYISGFGSATLGDAALAGAAGGGSQIGYNLANVGQTVDEINNASRLSNFLGGQTQNLVGNTASSMAGPFGPVVNVGRNVLNGAPIGKAVTGAVGSAALGKAVQGVSKATGIPPVVVGSGANYGLTGNAPQASDIAKAAISVYAADKAKQRPLRPVRRA